MRFTVVWTRLASDRLAELWLDSEDREAVTRAAAAIERELAQRPLDVGESRDEDSRICIDGPLAVLYEVHEDDRKVEVLGVTPVRRRR